MLSFEDRVRAMMLKEGKEVIRVLDRESPVFIIDSPMSFYDVERVNKGVTWRGFVASTHSIIWRV